MTAASVTSISIVVPVYSGSAYVRELANEINNVRTSLASQHLPVAINELIFVDDSARDGSPEIIDGLASEHSWITALHLSRNYGQHSATIAGILHSSGDWVATMDEDLQHPPNRLVELLTRAILNRADIVYASPNKPVHQARFRDWSSRGVKRLMQWMTGNPQIRDVNSFRLLRGDVARCSASVAMHDTYFDVNLMWFSERVQVVEMDLVDKRFISTGKSGYRLKTLVAHAWRMLFSGQIRILQASTVLGMVVTVLSMMTACFIVLLKLTYPAAITVRGWPSLMVAITFFGGLILLLLGVALQYLSALVLRAHGRPTFFVIDRSRDDALRTALEALP